MIRPSLYLAAFVALFIANAAVRAAEPLLQSGDYLAVVGGPWIPRPDGQRHAAVPSDRDDHLLRHE
jgi:hypothetical protein